MTASPPSEPAPFTIEAFHNQYLPEGGGRVEAILRVTAAERVEAPSDLLLGFVIDVSESMTGARIDAVRAAAQTAIELLDERHAFFVVAFNDSARVVVLPRTATAMAKEQAKEAVRSLEAGGGTAMSQGLALARSVFAPASGAVRQCIFLTDGRNESERPTDVDVELNRCAGMFTCNCWGVGTDWQMGEVQEIARALHGTASLIPEPQEIDAAFREAVRVAKGKSVRDVRVRVWTPATAEVVTFEQVSPEIVDLTARATSLPEQVREYATGSWAASEVRDYRVTLQVRPADAGEDMLAARPSVLLRLDGGDEEIRSPAARIFARWTTDETLFTPPDPTVAHYRNEAQIATDIQQGLVARERGNLALATQLLGRAVQRAHASGNGEMTARLEKVVDVVDAETGEVVVKSGVERAATMDLHLKSTTTRRPQHPKEPGGPQP